MRPEVGREDAGHDLDEGRFPGAIVADQADDLVAADGEVDVAERLDRAEEFLHILEANDVAELPSCDGVRGCLSQIDHHFPLNLMPSMASASASRRRMWNAPRAPSASPRFMASKMALWRGMKCS